MSLFVYQNKTSCATFLFSLLMESAFLSGVENCQAPPLTLALCLCVFVFDSPPTHLLLPSHHPQSVILYLFLFLYVPTSLSPTECPEPSAVSVPLHSSILWSLGDWAA
jgi:hypothetical protein